VNIKLCSRPFFLSLSVTLKLNSLKWNYMDAAVDDNNELKKKRLTTTMMMTLIVFLMRMWEFSPYGLIIVYKKKQKKTRRQQHDDDVWQIDSKQEWKGNSIDACSRLNNWPIEETVSRIAFSLIDFVLLSIKTNDLVVRDP